ncbi:multidrug resistance efflux transporter family protein [Exiguobacterium sp. SL-10]|uniref:DMT family transporter n=1 Tax=Exiguobacterium sp. SL-10 TaxID=2510962 RepID=UPI00103BABB9|nr:multidrug resistance efflux transporter family protein [Exiguobacterium sp. SL-10]TCI30197.1 multidrug resistance efflux transporter family protein [Exiguobacterium sp. SL-10]
MRPLLLGVLAALFFASTFVLNESMQVNGGSWAYSASLRFLFMIPLLAFVVYVRGGMTRVRRALVEQPGPWLVWGTVGFGLFYVPICLAAEVAPPWLIAGTWQVTIIAGALLSPLFRRGDGTRERIPWTALRFSGIILFGVVLMQVEFLADFEPRFLWIGVVPVLIAAFAYPLGNRKMMAHTDLDVFERILGMCIGSLPVWLLLFGYGLTTGAPSGSQLTQTLLVALLSGVVATVLFFKATDLVKHDMGKLATVEATQALEVLFALIGELIFLQAHLPSGLSLVGISLVMVGVVLHSRSQFNVKESLVPAANRYDKEG